MRWSATASPCATACSWPMHARNGRHSRPMPCCWTWACPTATAWTGAVGQAHVQRSEEHTSELQSRLHLVCRLLLEKKKKQNRVQDLTSSLLGRPAEPALSLAILCYNPRGARHLDRAQENT